MPVYSFRKISIRGEKTGVCKHCGKKHKISKEFWQTQNFWNKKSEEEIYAELEVEREKWLNEPVPDSHNCKARLSKMYYYEALEVDDNEIERYNVSVGELNNSLVETFKALKKCREIEENIEKRFKGRKFNYKGDEYVFYAFELSFASYGGLAKNNPFAETWGDYEHYVRANKVSKKTGVAVEQELFIPYVEFLEVIKEK